jgi:drug/metabolite transporter (DMT)-like permease
VPVAVGAARGDPIHPLQAVGFAAALGGSLLASVERSERRPQVAAGVGWALLALVGFGGYFVPMHAAAAHDWLWPAFVFRCTTIVLAWTVAAARRELPRGVSAHLPALAAVGLLDTSGVVLFAAASSTHGLVSVVSVLASLYSVVTVLLARLWLGERVQRSQDAGVLVALVGVGLITAG